MKPKYANLTILYNGCGQPMHHMGPWPIQYPKSEENKATQFATMYTCTTCRIPCSTFDKGYPCLIKIIEPDLEGATVVEAA